MNRVALLSKFGATNPNMTTASIEPKSPDSSAPTQRLMSVDALRGFDMFWIIGADSLVAGLNQLTKSRPASFLATQLEHVDWEKLFSRQGAAKRSDEFSAEVFFFFW